jgi:hypothetical protein
VSGVESLASGVDATTAAASAATAAAPQLGFSQAATVLRCASRLYEQRVITEEEKAALKNVIVRSDARILDAAAAFEADGSLDALLEELVRVAAVARRETVGKRGASISSSARERSE